MGREEVPITGTVLGWARREAGLSHAELAQSAKVSPEDIEAWEREERRPAQGEFSKMVKALERPSALFFLPEPPLEAGIPTSLRSAPGMKDHALAKAEVRQIRWARRLQKVVSWVLREEGAPGAEIPTHALDDPPETAAVQMRTSSQVSTAEQLEWASPGEAFRAWRSWLENTGVLVLQLQLGKESIRGFSAWDDHAPVIAVNNAYHPTARIFTLMHELGHLATRTDAACFGFISPKEAGDSEVERWCEQFAATFLLPRGSVRAIAADLGVTEASKTSDVEVVRRLANKFKVSRRATALRLQELGLAPDGLYNLVVREYEAFDWNIGGGGGGQPAPEKRLSQLGHRTPEILLDAAAAGLLNQRDLSDYLRLTTGQVEDLRSLVGVG